MPRWNTWKNTFDEILAEEPPAEWKAKWGGQNNKQVLARRLIQAMVEEKAYHLLPKLLEFLEPSTKHTSLEIVDWHIEARGIPTEALIARLEQVLVTADRSEVSRQSQIPAILDEASVIKDITGESRTFEPDTPQRPANGVGGEEPTGGQETGQVVLGSHSETAAADRDSSI